MTQFGDMRRRRVSLIRDLNSVKFGRFRTSGSVAIQITRDIVRFFIRPIKIVRSSGNVRLSLSYGSQWLYTKYKIRPREYTKLNEDCIVSSRANVGLRTILSIL